MFSLCHKVLAESMPARNMIVLEKVRFVHMIRKAGESERLAMSLGGRKKFKKRREEAMRATVEQKGYVC
ncbi:uncharacterized protein EAF01_010627 [Botrytis porri]|nr:uncharacterized protein EAF01_010627 [Botrytis porri]KAF7890818.1 hypothetical protein EAF01_010627 [Botrytis porri]